MNDKKIKDEDKKNITDILNSDILSDREVAKLIVKEISKRHLDFTYVWNFDKEE